MGWREELLNGLQAASNAVAGNVSGPVDLLNLGLGKLGLPVSDAPVGGSAWMAARGLTRPVQPGASQVAGETLGLLGPALVANYAPQIARGLLAAGDAMPSMSKGGRFITNQDGKIVWHGSPHKFDKFDASKIGSGEGAQAYGHGLYASESQDVGRRYQSALSADRGFSFAGESGLTRAQVQDLVNARYGSGYLDGVIRPSGVADSFIDDMVTGVKRTDGTYPRQYKPGSQRAKLYDELRGMITHADPGALYKIDLPDQAIAKMLDWDSPVAEPLRKQISSAAMQKFGSGSTGTSGRNLYEELAKEFKWQGSKNPAADASEFLRQQGIPGIRYLDGMSRGAGQGSYNYVVFPGNEHLLKILERNGVPIGGLLD